MTHKWDILETKPEGVETVHAWTNIYSTVEGCDVHRAYVKPVLEFVDQKAVSRVLTKVFKDVTDNDLRITCSEHPYRSIGERKHIWVIVEYLGDKKVDSVERTLEEKFKDVTEFKFVCSYSNHQSFDPRVLVGIHCHIDEVFDPDEELTYRNNKTENEL